MGLIDMSIIKYLIQSIIIIFTITAVFVAAFELSAPANIISKPYIVKKECLDSMKRVQGSTYFYLMEHPKFCGDITIDMLKNKGYIDRSLHACDICRDKSSYKVAYKRSGKEICYIDVICSEHGKLSRQSDEDKIKGLPKGFVNNYIARVKTKLNLY